MLELIVGAVPTSEVGSEEEVELAECGTASHDPPSGGINQMQL